MSPVSMVHYQNHTHVGVTPCSCEANNPPAINIKIKVKMWNHSNLYSSVYFQVDVYSVRVCVCVWSASFTIQLKPLISSFIFLVGLLRGRRAPCLKLNLVAKRSPAPLVTTIKGEGRGVPMGRILTSPP